MELRKISETASKITIGWDPVPGATAGYRGHQEGVTKWTQTQSTQMVFAKDAKVEVQALGVVDKGVYPPVAPPPPTTPEFTTNITDGQEITLPFDWTASVLPAPDSVQFWADGTLLEEDTVDPFVHELALAAGSHDLGLCAWHQGVRTCYTPVPGGKFATITITGTEPPPTPSGYTHRFATFNPSTDKVTGTLNRFPPSYSWWIPGTPEGSPWPKGGGIFPINHAVYGPGFNMIVTDEMLYGQQPPGTVGPKDSNIVRFVGEPRLVDERLRRPVPGTTHTWEVTIMRPSGYTWFASDQYEGIWANGTNSGFGAAVGHHLYLQNNYHFPGFTYYFGRLTGAGPLGGTYWQRHNSGIPFNVNEYHTIRWEFLWSNPGVANGYIKAWTSVSGGPFQQWLNVTNVPTLMSGFVENYNQFSTLRYDLGRPPMSLHWHNLRVLIH